MLDYQFTDDAVSGSAGSFKKPLFGDDGATCIGVETEDGTRYFSDKVVLAAGAWSPTLVDLEDQCCSKVRVARPRSCGSAPLIGGVSRPGYTHISNSPQTRPQSTLESP